MQELVLALFDKSIGVGPPVQTYETSCKRANSWACPGLVGRGEGGGKEVESDGYDWGDVWKKGA